MHFLYLSIRKGELKYWICSVGYLLKIILAFNLTKSIYQ